MTKYKIECNEEQLVVLLKALDMYSRTGMGQLDISLDEFLRNNFYKNYYNIPTTDDVNITCGEAVEAHINSIKALVWQHPPNGSYGIFNKEVPIECREAYDILQILRKCRAKERIHQLEIKGDTELSQHIKITVDMSDYLPANKAQPPVCAKVLYDQNNKNLIFRKN